MSDLNIKLDEYENRTQFIENASKFYAKHENWLTENIERLIEYERCYRKI